MLIKTSVSLYSCVFVFACYIIRLLLVAWLFTFVALVNQLIDMNYPGGYILLAIAADRCVWNRLAYPLLLVVVLMCYNFLCLMKTLCDPRRGFNELEIPSSICFCQQRQQQPPLPFSFAFRASLRHPCWRLHAN